MDWVFKIWLGILMVMFVYSIGWASGLFERKPKTVHIENNQLEMLLCSGGKDAAVGLRFISCDCGLAVVQPFITLNGEEISLNERRNYVIHSSDTLIIPGVTLTIEQK